jgi:hypothetical protein
MSHKTATQADRHTDKYTNRCTYRCLGLHVIFLRFELVLQALNETSLGPEAVRFRACKHIPPRLQTLSLGLEHELHGLFPLVLDLALEDAELVLVLRHLLLQRLHGGLDDLRLLHEACEGGRGEKR